MIIIINNQKHLKCADLCNSQKPIPPLFFRFDIFGFDKIYSMTNLCSQRSLLVKPFTESSKDLELSEFSGVVFSIHFSGKETEKSNISCSEAPVVMVTRITFPGF